jgi:hypothetical protein
MTTEQRTEYRRKVRRRAVLASAFDQDMADVRTTFQGPNYKMMARNGRPRQPGIVSPG